MDTGEDEIEDDETEWKYSFVDSVRPASASGKISWGGMLKETRHIFAFNTERATICLFQMVILICNPSFRSKSK